MMMDPLVFERIAKRIASYRDEMVQMQVELTAIPALSPENGGTGEFEKAQFLIGRLRELGFDSIEEYPVPDERVPCGYRPNVVVSVKGRREEGKVWILTHLDIVPPGELSAWDVDPYQGYEKDGRVYGRGTEDNQQDLVASIYAAKAFMDEGMVPERSLGLVFVSDEETGSKCGLEHILMNRSVPFKEKDIIVVPDFGNEEGSIIEVAEKSMLWVRFRTRGIQCHASKPSIGINAFTAASHLVVSLGELRRHFDTVDPVYQPPESTFEPTKKEANVPNVNTIPGDDVFYCDCRVLPIYPLKEVLDQMRMLADEIETSFGVTVKIDSVYQTEAPPPTPADAPVVRALQAAIKDVYRVSATAVGIGGGTVAALFRKEGLPAAVWCRIGHSAHMPNENCLIDSMIGNARVYAHLCLQA